MSKNKQTNEQKHLFMLGKNIFKVFDMAYTTGALLLSEWVVLLGKNIP